MPRDDATLLDMANAARLVLGFTQGMDKPTFLQDAKTQSAVLHQLLVVGEAVKRLSPAFRDAHPERPWRRMAGMRDKLIHADDAVDLDEVWRVVEKELPPLLAWLEPRLPSSQS